MIRGRSYKVLFHIHNHPTQCSHYFVNGGWFTDDNHVLSRIDAIRHIPATIVQGRYDVVTPMKTAWELHKASDRQWPIFHRSPSHSVCTILVHCMV